MVAEIARSSDRVVKRKAGLCSYGGCFTRRKAEYSGKHSQQAPEVRPRMKTRYTMPAVSDEEATPLVKKLVALVERLMEDNQRLAETVQGMRDEIAVLKGEKAKPKFKSSKMDEQADPGDEKPDGAGEQKRPGSAKRSKTAHLTIHEERVINPEAIPVGSRLCCSGVGGWGTPHSLPSRVLADP